MINYQSIICAAVLLLSAPALAGGKADPLLAYVKVDQLEARYTDESQLASMFEAEAWMGHDLDKFWVKLDMERLDSETEELEVQALYSRAIASYWDLQVGWRKDFKPKPSRDWLVIGINGLAPYFFETNGSLFLGESGQVGIRFESEYELLFTQQWILTPEVELNIYSKDDRQTGIGQGLSDIELGLRLRYEIKPGLAPYIGVNWERKFGNSADFARDHGESDSDLQWLVGMTFWF